MSHFQTNIKVSINSEKQMHKKKENKLDKMFDMLNSESIYINDKKEKVEEKGSRTFIKASAKIAKKNSLTNSTKTSNSNKNVISSPSNHELSPDEFHEYQGLSYKATKLTPTKIVDLYDQTENSNVDKTDRVNKKISIEKDFRIKFKTEICKYFQVSGVCKYGDSCAFAHGFEDIREKSFVTNNYKTKKCKQFFEFGYCSYGSRCQFSHKNPELQQNLLEPTRKFSYKETINNLINSSLTHDNFLSEDVSRKRPRLKTFENIVKNTEINNNKLYEEVVQNKKEDTLLCNSTIQLKDDSLPTRARFMSA